MKKKIINGILAGALLFATSSAFVSCKDNDADDYATLTGQYNDLQTKYNKLDQDLTKLTQRVDTIKSCQCNMKDLKDAITWVNTYGTDAAAAGAWVKANGTGASNAITWVNTNGAAVAALPTSVENIIKNYYTQIRVDSLIGNYYTQNEVDSIINALPKPEKYDGYTKEQIDSIINAQPKPEKVDAYTKAEVDSIIANLPKAVEPVASYTKEQVDSILKSYLTEKQINDLLKDYYTQKESDSLFAKKADLADYLLKSDKYPEVLTVADIIQIINDEIDKLENKVTEALQSWVNSVIVERTNNSIYGSIALPGVNPLILASYFGAVGGNGIAFPAENLQEFAGLSDADIFQKNAGDILVSEAGKIYLTLNPTEVDASNVKFSLVNSRGEEAIVKLSTPVESDALIGFGWNNTRGANGLYEATAIIPQNNLKEASSYINLSAMKSDLARIKNEMSKKAVANLVADLYEVATTSNIPAYALKAEYSNPLFGDRSVLSGYNVAAFAVTPLAYTFDPSDALKINKIPGLGRLQSLVDNIISEAANKIKIDLGIDPNIEVSFDIKIKKINFAENLSDISVTIEPISVWMTGPNGSIYDENGEYWGELGQTQEKTIYITKEELAKSMGPAFNELIDEINESISSGVDLSDLEDLLKQLANLDDKINGQIGDAITDIKAQINSYITTYTQKVLNVWNTLPWNSLVQPTLLVKSGNTIHRANGRTPDSGEVSLLPTSYTAELLAPAYKKFVVITAIDGVAATAADQSGDLGKVLDGTVQEVKFTPEAGKKYTIAYSAVDYYGNVATNYYTIIGK